MLNLLFIREYDKATHGDMEITMAESKQMDKSVVKKCAEIYINAYGEAPWNEKYKVEDVEKYITDFLDSDTKCAYVLVTGEEIIGVALGLIIPCVGSRYFRLEDVCIDSEYQRMGYGREFIELMANCLREKDCDSILLGTQREYPSHNFYLKNGFREIDSVLLYREIER